MGEELLKCLELLPWGIFLLDHQRAIHWANRKALVLLGAEDLYQIKGESCRKLLCMGGGCLFEEKGEVHGMPFGIEDLRGEFKPVLRTIREVEIWGEKFVLEVFEDFRWAETLEFYLEGLIEEAEAFFLLVDRNLRIKLINKSFARHLGYSKEELLGRNILDFVAPEDLPRVKENHQRRLRGDPTVPPTYEIKYVTKTGQKRHLVITPTVIRETGDTLVTAIDVTERRELQALFRSIFESAPLGIWLTQYGRFKMVNPRFKEDTGFTEEEARQLSPLELVVEEDRGTVREIARRMLKGEALPPYEFRYVKKDGSIRWGLGAVVPTVYEGKRAVLGYIMDLDRQKALEKELRFEKERLEALIENAPIIVLLLDKDYRILLCNRYAEGTIGVGEEELLGRSILEFLSSSSQEAFLQFLGERPSGEKAFPLKIAQGEERLIMWRKAFLEDPEGTPLVLLMGEDVTEKQRLERRIRSMLDGLPHPAWLLSKDCRILLQNRTAEQSFKSTLGQPCWEGIWKGAHSTKGDRCYFCEADESLRRRAAINKEIASGGRYWQIWWVPLDDDMLLHYAVDVTAYKEAERRLFELSVTDPLTRIYNRRYFLKRLEEEIERVRRGGPSFSLVMFDLDFFKGINDRFGHKAGDRVLIHVVELVRTRIRKIDVFARWGGEEFVILLPNTPLFHAARLAEELRKRIEGSEVLGVGTVTCSFGVTEYTDGDNADSILSRADNLLYEAKRAGRNKVKYA